MVADSDHLKSELVLLEQVFHKNKYTKQEVMPVLYNKGEKWMPKDDDEEIKADSVLPYCNSITGRPTPVA